MSLIYVMKSRGPRIVPCGTPDNTSSRQDFQDDLLFPVAEKSFNPAVDFSSDSIVVEFIEQSGMRNLIEGFPKVK